MKYDFTENELNVILAGLGELAAKHSIELIVKIKQEANRQYIENKVIEQKE